MSSPESTPAAANDAEEPVRGQLALAGSAWRRRPATDDDFARLATREGDAWVCGCGHKFGTPKNTTAENLDAHEESSRHKTKLANKQKLAKKALSKASPTLHGWFKPNQAAVASPPVASSAQARQQEAGSGVACLDEVNNEGLPEPSSEGDNTLAPVATVAGDPEVLSVDEDTNGSRDEPLDDDDNGDNGNLPDLGGINDIDDIEEVDDGEQSIVNLSVPCPGFRPDLVGDPPSLCYPFGIHGEADAKVAWMVQLDGTEVRLFAKSEFRQEGCTGKSPSAGGPCAPCAKLEHHPKVQGLLTRSKLDAGSEARALNHRFLTLSQVIDRPTGWKTLARVSQLNIFNLRRKTRGLIKKLDLEKRITLLIAQNNIPGVRRVLAQSLHRGDSSQGTLGKLESALSGTCRSRKWKEEDKDLALLVLRLGGPALLHVLQKTTGLPGLSYTRKYAGKVTFEGCPSGNPRSITRSLRANIKTIRILFQHCQPALWKVGTDEVAINQRPDWNSKDNMVYGYCWEHQGEDIVLQDMTTVHNTKDLVDTGRLHFSKEAIVVTMARIGSSNGRAVPVWVAGSCKSSNYLKQLDVFEEVLKVWKEPMAIKDGEANPRSAHEVLGPISNYASDGDSNRRRAFKMLTEGYKMSDFAATECLVKCELMDLMLGEEGISACYDPKHLFKRLRERLKSLTTGIKIGDGAPIRRDALEQLLSKHQPDLPLKSLLDPLDSQNVPAAVKLLRAIGDLGAAPPAAVPGLTTNPFLRTVHTDIQVLAAFNNCLLDVIFDSSKTISGLLEGLSCMSHMALALYRENKTAFIPGQLYHDLQATIRCAFVVVAQAKEVCPSLKLYLFQLGTDNVENLFAVFRTMNHSCNFSMNDLIVRIAHASQVDDVWWKHEEWRRASRRLMSTSDHMNTTTWDLGPDGNTSVGTVDLVGCWQEGRRRSVDVLKKHPLYKDITVGFFMDLAENPSLNGKVTMFYPNGEGAGMPGVGQSTEDEEQTPGGEVQGGDPGSVPQETPTSSTTSAAASAQGVEVDADTVVDLSNTGMSEEDVDCHVEPLLEGMASGVSTPFDAWVDIDGKEVHKTTVTRIFLGPDSAPSSNDRARRVRGYGRGNSGSAAANGLKEPDGGDDMWADALIGQPFATLVELVTGSHALCIFTLTKNIDRTAGSAQLLNGIRVRLREAVGNGASTDDVGAPSVETGDVGAPLVEGTERGEGQGGAEISWRWDGGRTHGGKECKIPAALALPLNPACGESSENVVFTLDSLKTVLQTLEMLVDTTPDASSKVLKASQTSAAGLPYHECLQGSSRTPDIPSRLDCLLCGRCSIPVLEMRPHVSAHVLQAQMDVDAGHDAAEILNPETCCFCGRIGTCVSALRTGTRKTTFVCTSTCPHAPRVGAKEVMDVGIQVGQVKKVSTNQPCTNLPMKCELCPGTFYVWKYLMPAHIAQKHGGANGVLQGGSPDFRASYTIPEDERKQVSDLLAVVPRPGARKSSSARTTSRKRSGDNHQGARGAARPRTSEGGASGDVGGSTAPATGQARHDDDVVRI